MFSNSDWNSVYLKYYCNQNLMKKKLIENSVIHVYTLWFVPLSFTFSIFWAYTIMFCEKFTISTKSDSRDSRCMLLKEILILPNAIKSLKVIVDKDNP